MTDAIKGLVAFVDGLHCDGCDGTGNRSWYNPDTKSVGPGPCDECKGTGKLPAARAALEAFVTRKPLRDDYELFSLVTYTACVCDTEARDVLDALDDAILGPRTPAKEE